MIGYEFAGGVPVQQGQALEGHVGSLDPSSTCSLTQGRAGRTYRTKRYSEVGGRERLRGR